MLQNLKTVWVVLAIAALAGCDGPQVAITHHLPPAAATPRDLTAFRVGKQTVESPAGQNLPAHVSEELTSHLREVDLLAEANAAVLVGTYTITVDDNRGSRTVRRDGQSVRLPSLVRRMTLEGQCQVRPPGSDSPAVTLVLQESYSSLVDSRVRGDMGLRRGDDPDAVPAVETIARELLSRSARSAVSMLAPETVTVSPSLRGSWNPRARDGQDAARRGDYSTAADHFRKALQDDPNSPELHFNLAAVAEKLGRLKLARQHYTAAVKNREDPQAEAGLRRVTLVLAHKRRGVPAELDVD
ncbi:MAG: tetratricopeptide repeat protein [Phycisphaerae bacterium]